MNANPIALALLDILQTQNQGKLPNEVQDTMVMTIDITDLIISKRAEMVADVFSVAPGVTFGTAGSGILQVPQQQAWFVHNASLRGTSAAAGTCIYTLRASSQGSTLDLDDSVSLAVSTYTARCMKRPGFWLRPGDALGFGNEGTAAQSAVVTAMVSKFRSGA